MEVGKRGASPKREGGAFSDVCGNVPPPPDLSWPLGETERNFKFLDDSFPHGFPRDGFRFSKAFE
jgi:hypothetical protein